MQQGSIQTHESHSLSAVSSRSLDILTVRARFFIDGWKRKISRERVKEATGKGCHESTVPKKIILPGFQEMLV